MVTRLTGVANIACSPGSLVSGMMVDGSTLRIAFSNEPLLMLIVGFGSPARADSDRAMATISSTDKVVAIGVRYAAKGLGFGGTELVPADALSA